MCARETVRTTTSDRRRESAASPGGIRAARDSKMDLVDSKDFGVSDRRYFPVARIKFSAMKGCEAS